MSVFQRGTLPKVGAIVEVIRTMPYEVEQCVYVGRSGSHLLPEVWIDVLGVWCQMDGRAYSGDMARGFEYPGRIGAWRLRRAIRRWQKEYQGERK